MKTIIFGNTAPEIFMDKNRKTWLMILKENLESEYEIR